VKRAAFANPQHTLFFVLTLWIIYFLFGSFQDRRFLGTSYGAYRKFATDADNRPTPPVTHSTDSASTNLSSTLYSCQVAKLSCFSNGRQNGR